MAAVKGDLDDGMVVAYCADVAGIGIAPEIHKCCRAAAKGIDSAGVRVDEVEVNLSFSRKAFLSLRAHWMLSQHPVGWSTWIRSVPIWLETFEPDWS